MPTIESNGVALSVSDEGNGPAVMLLHGFPELAYSWRHQVGPLVEAGYRVISYDQRGYGSSPGPDDVPSYSLDLLVDDAKNVLDDLGVVSAAIVGHDWGSIVTYSAAVMHPDRFRRVVSLNVPYRGACWGFPTMAVIREQLADRFGYIIDFHDGHKTEERFAADPAAWLWWFYLGGARGRRFLTEDEFARYLDAFEDSGVTGPVNWYRNIDNNAAAFAKHHNATIEQPTLFIAADADPVLPLELAEGMERWVPNLSKRVIKECGHWTQQERPDEVNAALIDWLRSTE